MVTTKQYMLFVSSMIIVLTFLPLAYANLPVIIGSYHFWAILWGVSILTIKPQVLYDKLMLLVWLYGLYLAVSLFAINYSMDLHSKNMLWADFYPLAVNVSIFAYYTMSRDLKGLARLAILAIICIFITACLSIAVSSVFPSFSRDYLVVQYSPDRFSASEISKILYYQRFGAGSRGDGFGFMLLIPILFYFFHYYKSILGNKKWILLFLILVCIFATFRMQYATLLLFSVAIFVLSFVVPKRRGAVFFFLLILVIVVSLIPTDFYSGLLYKFGYSLSPDNALSSRLIDMSDYVNQGGGEITTNGVSERIDLRYKSAINCWLGHPLFGVWSFGNVSNYGKLGEGHLYLMNQLAITGLVGFSLWLYIFYFFVKNTSGAFSKQYKYYFILSVCFTLLYGLVKVIITRQAWALVFVVLPGAYYMPLLFHKLSMRDQFILNHKM